MNIREGYFVVGKQRGNQYAVWFADRESAEDFVGDNDEAQEIYQVTRVVKRDKFSIRDIFASIIG